MMPGRSNGAAAAGFTLIELMLAVSILAIILVMVAGSFNVVAHGKIHAENRLTANQVGRSILWQMSQELRGAVRTTSETAPYHMLLLGQGHMQGGAALDSLTLSTLHAGHNRSVFGFGAEDVVSYTIRPNPANRGWFFLLRAQQSGLLPANTGPQAQPMVMADNLLSLHIRYFNGNIWDESWDSNSTAQANLPLPLAVSIDLQVAAPGGKPMNFSTEVAVPMAVLAR